MMAITSKAMINSFRFRRNVVTLRNPYSPNQALYNKLLPQLYWTADFLACLYLNHSYGWAWPSSAPACFVIIFLTSISVSFSAKTYEDAFPKGRAVMVNGAPMWLYLVLWETFFVQIILFFWPLRGSILYTHWSKHAAELPMI